MGANEIFCTKYHKFIVFLYRFIGASTYVYVTPVEKKIDNEINITTITAKTSEQDFPVGLHYNTKAEEKSYSIESFRLLRKKFSSLKKNAWLNAWSKVMLISSLFYGSTLPALYYYVLLQSDFSRTVKIAQIIHILNEVIWLLGLTIALHRQDKRLANMIIYLKWIYGRYKELIWSPSKDKAYLLYIFVRFLTILCTVGYVYLALHIQKSMSPNDISNALYIAFAFYAIGIIIFKFFLTFSPVYLFYGINVVLVHMYVDATERLLTDTELNSIDLIKMDKYIIFFINSFHSYKKKEGRNISSDGKISAQNPQEQKKFLKQIKSIGNELFMLHTLNDFSCLYFSTPVVMIFCHCIINIIVSFFTFTVMPGLYSIGSLGSFSSAATLILLCWSADKTEVQRDRLRIILVRIKMLTKNKEIKNEIQKILALMNEFHGFNMGRFFILAKARLVEILGFVATYVVILHQFQTTENNEDELQRELKTLDIGEKLLIKNLTLGVSFKKWN